MLNNKLLSQHSKEKAYRTKHFDYQHPRYVYRTAMIFFELSQADGGNEIRKGTNSSGYFTKMAQIFVDMTNEHVIALL